VQRDGKVWTATACTRVKAKPTNQQRNKEIAKMENLFEILNSGCSFIILELAACLFQLNEESKE
jgi:hypothetical protein